uniref:Uncharacterized protein n=1 Tax=Phlebotomus papatasi TaxID=29031 RepID=A0A1B0D752_PHLPP
VIDLHSDTPRRVFFTVQPTGVQFSDYLFAGENDDTVRENVSKLMDIDLEPTDIFLMVEAADDTEDLPDTDVQFKEDNQCTQTETKTDWPEVFLKLLAIVSLLVALIGAYFAVNQSQ